MNILKKSRVIFYGGLCSALFAVLSPQTQAATCSYAVTNDWGSGLTAAITITNNGTSAINGWSVNWTYSANRITNLWNATLTGTNPYNAASLSWNAGIAVGQSVSFGFQVDKNGGSAEVPQVTGSVCGTVTATSTSSSAITSSKTLSLIHI